MEVYVHTFLALALDGGEWLFVCANFFTAWTRGSLNTVKEKSSYGHKSQSLVIKPVA
jgi:hypothetical protein